MLDSAPMMHDVDRPPGQRPDPVLITTAKLPASQPIATQPCNQQLRCKMLTTKLFKQAKSPAIAGLSRPCTGKLLAALLLSLMLLTTVACGESEAEAEVNRQEIEDLLLDYLPKLGQAYAQRDPQVLEGLAVPKEMSKIAVRIRELTAQGRIFEPKFKELTVEDVSVWNYSNAFVTTFEVWDLQSYSTGERVLMSESLDQGNRVKYQLKRRDDSWVVLYRELDQTFDQE